MDNNEYEETENAIKNALAPDEEKSVESGEKSDTPAPEKSLEAAAPSAAPAEPAPTPAPQSPAPDTELFADFDESDASDYDPALAKALNALKKSVTKQPTISRDELAAMIREELAKATKPSATATPRTTLARPDGRGGNMDSSTTSDASSGDEALAAELDARIREYSRA